MADVVAADVDDDDADFVQWPRSRCSTGITHTFIVLMSCRRADQQACLLLDRANNRWHVNHNSDHDDNDERNDGRRNVEERESTDPTWVEDKFCIHRISPYFIGRVRTNCWLA